MKKEKHPTEKVGRNPKISKRKKARLKKLPVLGFGKFNRETFNPKGIYKRLKKVNRNLLLAGSLGFVLIFVGIISIAFSSNTTKDVVVNEETVDESQIEEAPLISAGINLIEGTLQTKDNEGEWTDADENLEIVEGTALRTSGATSRTSITLEDGSIVRLDGNSEIEFEELSLERVVIKHISGYTYNRVSADNERNYIVKTTEAQYEAIGTAFRTVASGDEQAVEVYENNVLETTTNRTAKNGEKLTVKSLLSPSDDGRVNKLDIEVVKKDPFIVWNRNLDLQNDLYKNKLGFLQDVTSPELNITSPQDGSTILLEPNASQGSIEISGNTEKSASVTARLKTNSDTAPIAVSVGDDGSFKSPVISSPIGSSLFEIVAKDRTGNTTTKTLRITFQAKSGAVTSGSIVLTTVFDSVLKVKASWAFSGTASAPDGVKILYGKNPLPTLSDNATSAISNNSTNIDIDKFDSGETYYFRACIYDSDEDECAIFSNQTSLDIP